MLLIIGTVLVDFHATETNGGSISWSLNDTTYFSITSSGVVQVASTDIDREVSPRRRSRSRRSMSEFVCCHDDMIVI